MAAVCRALRLPLPPPAQSVRFRYQTHAIPREGHYISFGLWSSWRSVSQSKGGLKNEPLKKPETPVGRFDKPQDSSVEKDPLERFPDDINPVTKEMGGPRGPEPTRYGDWERKGRCIDF